MNPLKPRASKGPEEIIQDAIVMYLRAREWFVMETHGNAFQRGFPDVYATHYKFGPRWIEVKNPLKYVFTDAQKHCFPKLMENGTKIWILVAGTETEYLKLWEPPNLYHYMKMH
jgi:hypothetical protein